MKKDEVFGKKSEIAKCIWKLFIPKLEGWSITNKISCKKGIDKHMINIAYNIRKVPSFKFHSPHFYLIWKLVPWLLPYNPFLCISSPYQAILKKLKPTADPTSHLCSNQVFRISRISLFLAILIRSAWCFLTFTQILNQWHRERALLFCGRSSYVIHCSGRIPFDTVRRYQ